MGELIPVDASGNRGHLNGIDNTLAAYSPCAEASVRQGQIGVDQIEMAAVHWHIQRFDRGDRGRLYDIQRLLKTNEVALILVSARSASIIDVIDVGCATHEREHHVITTDME